MQALRYTTLKGDLTSLSVVDIKGSPKDGNQGFFDIILFKQNVRRAMLAKGEERKTTGRPSRTTTADKPHRWEDASLVSLEPSV